MIRPFSVYTSSIPYAKQISSMRNDTTHLKNKICFVVNAHKLFTRDFCSNTCPKLVSKKKLEEKRDSSSKSISGLIGYGLYNVAIADFFCGIITIHTHNPLVIFGIGLFNPLALFMFGSAFGSFIHSRDFNGAIKNFEDKKNFTDIDFDEIESEYLRAKQEMSLNSYKLLKQDSSISLREISRYNMSRSNMNTYYNSNTYNNSMDLAMDVASKWYENGLICSQAGKHSEAIEYYIKSAKKGHDRAMTALHNILNDEKDE